jgi:transposase
MLGDIRQAQNVYIVTGYTDMRKGLRSLVPYVMQNFKMDPYDSGLFLFCGKKFRPPDLHARKKLCQQKR